VTGWVAVAVARWSGGAGFRQSPGGVEPLAEALRQQRGVGLARCTNSPRFHVVQADVGEGGPRLSPVALPDGACFAAVWSGVASDTPRAIDAFEAPASLARLRAILDRFWTAAAAGDRTTILETIAAYGAALEAIAGTGAGARRIAELAAAARACGFAAKGSGAVGGDCAIALGFVSGGLATLADAWRALGAEPLPVAVDLRGVRREVSHA